MIDPLQCTLELLKKYAINGADLITASLPFVILVSIGFIGYAADRIQKVGVHYQLLKDLAEANHKPSRGSLHFA